MRLFVLFLLQVWWVLTLFSYSLIFFQNAHDNIICAIVYNGQYLFTSSHSCIKVALLNLFQSFDFINFSLLLLPVMAVF